MQQPEQPPQQPQPPQYAWARPQWPLQQVETEPLEYHRLWRGAQGFKWGKTLLVVPLGVAFFFIFAIVVSIPFIPLILWLDPGLQRVLLEDPNAILDTQHPLGVAYSLVSLIIMIPAVWLALLIAGIRPTGRMWSAACRIRWGLLGKLLSVAVIAVIVMNTVGMGVGILQDPASLTAEEPSAATADYSLQRALISLVIIVLLVPLQATAEEVVFRGALMQALGSWMDPARADRMRTPFTRGIVRVLNSHWIVVIVPAIAFAFGHIYDIWGLLAVGLMGAVAGWLAWRTGGLEAGIAIHIVNNLVAFGFMVFAVGGETAQTEDSGGLGTFVGEIAGLAVFIWLTLIVFRRGGYGRTRIDLVTRPVPPAQAGAPSMPIAAPPVQDQPGEPRG